VTEKSEAIACARRCRSSRLTRWWTKKNNRKKWRAEEEERHKGLLTKKTAILREKAENVMCEFGNIRFQKHFRTHCLRLRLVVAYYVTRWTDGSINRTQLTKSTREETDFKKRITKTKLRCYCLQRTKSVFTKSSVRFPARFLEYIKKCWFSLKHSRRQ
jgi:hypothetical protein